MNRMVAFVTGGSSGLGFATVQRLLKLGAWGVHSYDTQKFPVDQLESIPEDASPDVRFSWTQGDVRDVGSVEKALQTCNERFGGPHMVVNCAGVAIAFKTFNFNTNLPHDLDEFRKLLDVNLLGTFNVNRLALKYMGKNEPDRFGSRGLLINTSSASATEGQTGQVAYSACSAAINGMTLPMARDLAQQGIRVVTIQPGFFETPLTTFLPENVIKYLGNCVPFPSRMGKPDEYAGLVESIALNPYINGTVLRLDGGLRIPS